MNPDSFVILTEQLSTENILVGSHLTLIDFGDMPLDDEELNDGIEIVEYGQSVGNNLSEVYSNENENLSSTNSQIFQKTINRKHMLFLLILNVRTLTFFM